MGKKRKPMSRGRCLFQAIFMSFLMFVWFALIYIVVVSGGVTENLNALIGLVACLAMNVFCCVFYWRSWRNWKRPNQ